MAVPPHYDSIRAYFADALNFLKGYHWLYRYPNTHVLVCKVFEQFPAEWLSVLKSASNDDLNKLSLGLSPEQAPQSLKQFCEEISKLKPTIPRKNCKNSDFKFPNNSSLCKKKMHEIVSLGPLVHEICSGSGCDFIIDVGTGLGYLPQFLHENHGYRGLGIEGSPDKVRLAKLKQLNYPRSVDHVSYVEHFVSASSEEQIRDMVKAIPMKSACITGLHACADLSVTILELFTKLDFAKSLVIMPCCYHRLKQSREGFENFPASLLLKEMSQEMRICDFLGVPFLRLACQGFDPDGITENKREERRNSCLFRAILQQVAHSEHCQVRRLKRKSGRMRAGSHSYETYLANLKHTHSLIGGEIDDRFLERMREKWTEHKGNAHLIEALATFQAAIQSICENVVLLDRVMFLKEKGVECFVVRVTDQGISPRCHALVATKP